MQARAPVHAPASILARVAVAAVVTMVAAPLGCTPILPTSADRMASYRDHAGHHVDRDGREWCRSDDVVRLTAAVLTPPADMPDAFENISMCVVLRPGCRPGVIGVGIALEARGWATPRSAAWGLARGNSFELDTGCAIPVAPDGYFLTAAHVVGAPGEQYVACIDESGDVCVVPLRVVWSTGVSLADADTVWTSLVPDLAVVHAPVRPRELARLADLDAIAPGTVLVNGRYVIDLDLRSGAFPYAAGVVLERGDAVGERRIRHVVTSAPFTDGDSGGPMLLDDGSVAAIASVTVLRWTRPFRSVGWWISQDQVQGIIDEDRARQAAGPARGKGGT